MEDLKSAEKDSSTRFQRILQVARMMITEFGAYMSNGKAKF
jgi:hypothetical protein